MGGGEVVSRTSFEESSLYRTHKHVSLSDTRLFAVDIACIQTCPVNALESIYNANPELGRI